MRFEIRSYDVEGCGHTVYRRLAGSCDIRHDRISLVELRILALA